METIFHVVPLISGGAIAALRFVKLHTDGTLKQCDTAGEDADGVNNYATPVTGAGISVSLNYDGFPVEVECAGTVTAGEIVQTDADGKAVTQTTGAALGKALSTGTNAVIRIKPLWSNASPQFAAIVSLTDSTGLSGTHDDVLAATTVPTTLTDSTGLSGTHDDTLAATTVPTITATNPAAPTAYSAHAAGGVAVTSAAATDLDTTAAALATLRNEVATYETAISALVVDVAAILSLLTVVVQNNSDTAQKIIEHNTLFGVLAQNQSDTAQKVLEILAALRTSGEITP